MVELVIYVCSKLSMILAPVLKKINLCLSKRNVLASKVFAHGFLSGDVQKCSGGDHHWYKFFCRVMGHICMKFGGAIAGKEESVVRVHLPCTGKCLWLIK